MNISFQHPYGFFFLIMIFPIIILFIFRQIKIKKKMKGFYKNFNNSIVSEDKSNLIFVIRVVCCIIAWISLVFAYVGISWGKEMVPVQKKGKSVSLVFDISYSMMAKDAPGNLTRLAAAADYAKILLAHTTETSVSVILAKGDGFTAVPLTEDSASVEELLDNLSPQLMTAPGTSLGKGLEAAIRSFPHNSSRAAVVWIFTDGDETDNALEPALKDAVNYGIPVVIIGFGSEHETSVLAGDGKTMVKTALRSKRMQNIVNEVIKNLSIGDKNRFSELKSLMYVDASEPGSALAILKSLTFVSECNENKDISKTFSYEILIKEHHILFLLIAIVFFVLNIVVNEFHFIKKEKKITKKNNQKGLFLFLILVPLLFSSCSNNIKDSKIILKSTWNWHQGKYHEATAGFLKVVNQNQTGNERNKDYALLGLALTYIKLNENAAAYLRLQQIDPNAPDDILFSKYYNSGVIEFYAGHYKQAAEYFRDSLKLRSADINSKINLELSQNRLRQEDEGNIAEQMNPVADMTDTNKERNSAIFDRIRKNDSNIWKNQIIKNQNTSSQDY